MNHLLKNLQHLLLFATFATLGSSLAKAQIIFPPTNFTATEVTARSAVINWEYTPTNVVSFAVYYRLATSPLWTLAGDTIGENGELAPAASFRLTGLAVGSTYVATAVTEGNDGDSTPNIYPVDGDFESVTFVTSGPMPPSCVNDAFEPNNSLATAQPVPTNKAIKAKICDLTDIDFFSFSNTQSKKNIRVTLSNLPTNYNLDIYNPFNGLQASSVRTGKKDEKIILNGLAAGKWTIQVTAGRGAVQSSEPYTLKAEISATPF